MKCFGRPDAVAKLTHTNRLAASTSPYLLQHAHNPVDWYPWAEEALARATRESKPIFLSVGYSTCYWCHVMEREVFENAEIAAMMNELFVNIKVDREQRPDLDEIYMTATQLMTAHGGWPNSVFLTPDLKPFFAGTYFGASDHAGRPGFPTLIRALADAWRDRQPEVLATAERATAAIREAVRVEAAPVGAVAPGPVVAERAVEQLAARYDAREGGFGGAPKFPQDFYYGFLIDRGERHADSRALEMALASLRAMAAGGIHDHVGGGFHRYATDAQWCVPHFEKMLYNQAQLVQAFVRAHESTGEGVFAASARDTLAFVNEVMTGPEGQVYSALDAETDAVEGAYFVWNRAEVEGLLSREQLEVFDGVFALEPLPNLPGHKHPEGGALFMRRPRVAVVGERVDGILRTLKRHRDARARPRLDDKVISGWNGMMIRAYAVAGAAFDETDSLARARRVARFILDRMRDERGHLLRLWRGGVAEQPAFHEDYAFVIGGLLALHAATDEPHWLESAIEFTRIQDEAFWDAEFGGYFFAPESADLIARVKTSRDGAMPSGNSVALHNLVELWEATHDERWKQRIDEMLRAFTGVLTESPAAHIHMVHGLARWLALQGSAKAQGTLERAPGRGSPETACVTATVAVERQRSSRCGEFRVIVDLAITEGWHINANAVSDPALIPTLVDVRHASDGARVSVVAVTYPEGRVFSGRVRIVVSARVSESVAPGTSLPLTVFLQYQACDEARCLPPIEQSIPISIEVEG